MISTAMLIEEDCQILLDRALSRKTICAFGEDGFGKYGRQDCAMWFKIQEIDVTIKYDDDNTPSEISGILTIQLAGYNSNKVGHIMTDHNFVIALGAFLKNNDIEPKVLSWPDTLEEQGEHFVAMHIDVGLLLGW